MTTSAQQRLSSGGSVQTTSPDHFLTASNLLSISRGLLSIPFAIVMLGHSPESRLWGAAIMVVAALTDKFDGVLARKYNQITEWGKILDPLADKVAVSVVAIVSACPRKYSGVVRGVVVAERRADFLGRNVHQDEEGRRPSIQRSRQVDCRDRGPNVVSDGVERPVDAHRCFHVGQYNPPDRIVRFVHQTIHGSYEGMKWGSSTR